MPYPRRWLYAILHPRYVSELEERNSKLERRLAYSKKMLSWYQEAHQNLKHDYAMAQASNVRHADGTPIRHGSQGIAAVLLERSKQT